MKKNKKYIGIVIVFCVFIISLIILRTFIVVNLLEVNSLFFSDKTFTKQTYLDLFDKKDYYFQSRYLNRRPFYKLPDIYNNFVIRESFILRDKIYYEKSFPKNLYDFDFNNVSFSELSNKILSYNKISEIENIKMTIIPIMTQKMKEEKIKYVSTINENEDFSILPKLGKDLDKYKNEFIKSMTQGLIAQRINKEPSHESNMPKQVSKKEEAIVNFHTLPNNKMIGFAVKNICYLALTFAKNGDYKLGFYLLHSVFYLTRILEKDYVDSENLINKMTTIAIRKDICDYILILANKCRNIDSWITKSIASDILDLVSYEYPLSKNIPYEMTYSKYFANYCFKSIGNTMDSRFARLQFEKQLSFYYKDIIENIDKPLYEVENLLKKHQEKIKNYNENYEKGLKYIITEGYISNNIINELFPNYLKVKQSHEYCLAKMEFTAIALLINSYYYDRVQLPNSMNELSEWFGKELPKDRLTNKSYVFFSNLNYIIFNEGLDKTPNTDDDFYFKF